MVGKMTSGTGNLDYFIKEYLIFRGFVQTAKVFEADIRVDKLKGFRPDLVVDYIISLVNSYDLAGLLDFWSYLDERVFSRLEDFHHYSTKRLYFSLLKLYVINATANNKQDKVAEFFTKLSVELQQCQDWKEWFALPFIKNPETNDTFSLYFTKHWQERLQLSLFNFISVVFQCMPTPTLLECHKTTSSSLQRTGDIPGNRKAKAPLLKSCMDMQDDFFTITQAIQVEEANPTKPKTSVAKGLIAKVKNQQQNFNNRSKPKSVPVQQAAVQPQSLDVGRQLPTVSSSSNLKLKRISAAEENELRQELFSTSKPSSANTKTPVASSNTESVQSSEPKEQEMTTLKKNWTEPFPDSAFISVAQFPYDEHRSSITHAKFSYSGHNIVSCDVDGVIKVWTKEVIPQTLATVMSASPVHSIQWIDRQDKLLLIGGKSYPVKLYDCGSKKHVREFSVGSMDILSFKVSDLSISKSENAFVSAILYGEDTGQISLWDINTGQRKMMKSDISAQSIQLCKDDFIIMAGCIDGYLKMIDTRTSEIVKSWKGHSGVVYSMQLSSDLSSIYTMDSDSTISQWETDSGKLLQSVSLHEDAAGPFQYTCPSSNKKIVHAPKDKLFALNSANSHILTCYQNRGLIYKLYDGEAKKDLLFSLHSTPVVAVDWAAGDTETCLTADMNGSIRLTTLLT